MRRLALVAMTLFLAAIAPTVAASNDLGIHTGTNGYLEVRQYFVQTQTAAQISWNNSNNINPTDLTVVMCTQNGSVSCGIKEVNIADSDWGDSGWYGQWDCISWESPTVCDTGWVDLNTYYGPYTDNVMRSLVCHEVGHAMGLAHTSDSTSCLLTYSPPWPVYLNAHDVGIINSKYP